MLPALSFVLPGATGEETGAAVLFSSAPPRGRVREGKGFGGLRPLIGFAPAIAALNSSTSLAMAFRVEHIPFGRNGRTGYAL